MSYNDPTGDGSTVALKIPPNDRCFLRRVFLMARGGIRDELADYPDQLQEPARLLREEAVYDDLLAALECGSIRPSPDLRHLLEDLTAMIDRENEYERVVAEHAALLGLGEQVGGGGER